jgi:hypothetical protein
MEYLYPSQKKLLNRETEIRIDTARTINAAIQEAIIVDGRSFGDFSKPGMIRIFNLILPGYTPPTR